MGGGGGGGGKKRQGAYLNILEMMMVSVLYKELEYKVEKLRYKKLEVIQPRIRIKSELPFDK